MPITSPVMITGVIKFIIHRMLWLFYLEASENFRTACLLRMQEEVRVRMDKIFAGAAQTYAYIFYKMAAGPIFESRYDQRTEVDGVEITSPMRKSSSLIEGIDKIEAFIHARLAETGHRHLIRKISLTYLKRAKNIEAKAATLPEMITANLPVENRIAGGENKWIIDRVVLAALVDAFASQYEKDKSDNERLFADDVFSPSAQAILHCGLTHTHAGILRPAIRNIRLFQFCATPILLFLRRKDFF